jgi:hypothetical protein
MIDSISGTFPARAIGPPLPLASAAALPQASAVTYRESVDEREVLSVTADTALVLRERFGSFHDAVVRQVVIAVADKSAEVELDAMDGAAEWAWKRIKFFFSDIEEWRFARINAATEIVFEASIHSHGDFAFVNFDGSDDAPIALSDADLDDLRSRSVLFIAARQCECRVADS